MKIQNILLLIFLLLIAATSCKKEEKEIKISEEFLTVCLQNQSCNYTFQSNADLERYAIVPGNYRLFIAQTTFNNSPGNSTTIYFKAPINGNSFELKAADFKNRVIYQSVCLACATSDLVVIDGYIKGINTTPDKPASESKWLVEASMILGFEGAKIGDQTFKNTVYIKQFYYPRN